MPFHRFGHMRDAPLVKVGQVVKKGDLIGYVGNTGNSTSPHCHYDGTYEKPKSWTQYIYGMTKEQVRAIYFDPNTYIDRSASLPCQYNRFTGYNFLDAVVVDGKVKGYHSGVDINSGKDGFADLGEPIRSTVDGTCVHVDSGHGWGNFCWIEETPKAVSFTSAVPDIKPSIIDPGELYVDEIIPLHTGTVPNHFMYGDVPRVVQGMYTVVCASVATTSLAAWHYKHATGKDIRFSIPANYVGANVFQGDKDDLQPGLQPVAALVDAETNGLVVDSALPFAKDPWAQPDGWYAGWYQGWLNLSAKRYKFNKFVVRYDSYDAVKEALYRQGPLVATINQYVGWETGAAPKSRTFPTHELIITGWDDDKKLYTVTDSASFSSDDNGIRFLHPANVYEAWAMACKGAVDVKQVQKEQAAAVANNANYYGKQRNIKLEQDAAAELVAAFKKFNNQSVYEAAGKFWEILIRARAYGGYNTSYYKWGRWYPGDLVNWVFAWRRDPKKVPFDLNKPRNAQ